MENNMWQETGAKNGASRGGEGERFWVSEKTEPVSFQPQSNNNQQKCKKSRDIQGHSPSFFADQENNMYFQPRMRLKKGLNTRGSLQQQIKN